MLNGWLYESGKVHWPFMHRRWLSAQSFDEPAQNIVFQDYVEAIGAATDRKDAHMKRIEELVPEWKHR